MPLMNIATEDDTAEDVQGQAELLKFFSESFADMDFGETEMSGPEVLFHLIDLQDDQDTAETFKMEPLYQEEDTTGYLYVMVVGSDDGVEFIMYKHELLGALDEISITVEIGVANSTLDLGDASQELQDAIGIVDKETATFKQVSMEVVVTPVTSMQW